MEAHARPVAVERAGGGYTGADADSTDPAGGDVTERDFAYAAGLIEAKGSVWTGTNGVTVAVTDSDPRPLRWLQTAFGGEFYLHDRTKNKPVWRWRMRENRSGDGIARMVADILPHLRFRRAEFINPPPPRSDRGVRYVEGAG